MVVRGEITVPGDKSISHRALLFGALAQGVTEITGFLPGEDCLSTLACLRAMGVEVTEIGTTHLKVLGRGTKGLSEPGEVLDCGNSGTTARLLLGILSALPFTSSLTGDHSLRSRPMGRVVEPLRMMGAEIEGEGEGKFLPLKIKGRKLKGIKYHLPVASAQLKSALILAAFLSGEEMEIVEPTASRDHTERMLNYLGAEIGSLDGIVRVRPGKLTGKPISIPGDISSAAFFLVAASLNPSSELTIKNVGVNPTRTGVIEALRKMGADIRIIPVKKEEGEPAADIFVRGGTLKGTEISGHLIPRLIDEIPVLAVAAACAQGRTVIKDAGELKVKETDRIKAVVTELKKLGVNIKELPDGMVIEGGQPLRGSKVKTYGDHRMAMALEVADLVTEGEVELDDKECVNISFPGFFSLLESIRQEYK